jgi:hypothetical protein
MAPNALLLKLVEQSAAPQSAESELKDAVRNEIEHNFEKACEERAHWFKRYSLPPASVLARLRRFDRDAVLAHFRAKELRKVADAMHADNDYEARLARKRLERVDAMTKAFKEVKRDYGVA